MANSDLAEALTLLDHDNDEHWTTDGQPRVDVLQDLVGDEALTRDDIKQAAPEFVRQPASPSIEDQLKAVDAELEALVSKRDDLVHQITALHRTRSRLYEKIHGKRSEKDDVKARLRFIRSQAEQRAKRAAARTNVLKSLRSEDLDPRAPIDRRPRQPVAPVPITGGQANDD